MYLSKEGMDEVLDKRRGEFRSHFISGIIYVIITWLMLLDLILINS